MKLGILCVLIHIYVLSLSGQHQKWLNSLHEQVYENNLTTSVIAKRPSKTHGTIGFAAIGFSSAAVINTADRTAGKDSNGLNDPLVNDLQEPNAKTFAASAVFSSASELRAIGTPSKLLSAFITNTQAGIFLWDKNSTLAEDGLGVPKGAGTVIRPNNHTGSGRWLRVRTPNEVNVAWFGNIGEDDSALFQAAHDSIQEGTIYAPAVREGYWFNYTVKIGSNRRFVGFETVIKSNPNKTQLSNGDVGYFPTTLFTNSNHTKGNNDISINGFILHGNDQHYPSGKAKDKSGVASILEFIRVRGLNLNNNHIKKYYSNFWDFKESKDLSEEEQRGYTAIDLRWTENVVINNFVLTDSRREGLEFWRSKNIRINNFQSNNTDLCTPISVWYSANVHLTNSTINESKTSVNCSTINWVASNSKIARNHIVGGRGIDIGNEIGRPFNTKNTDIVNNIIGGGIYVIGKNELDHERLLIKNNIFTSTSSKNNHTIQIASANNVVIENNYINVEMKKSGIYLWGSTTDKRGISNISIKNNVIKNASNGILARVGTIIKNIEISHNTINAITAIFFDVRNSGGLIGVSIHNNRLDSQGRYDKSAVRNVGVGFRYNAKLNKEGAGGIFGIKLNNNIVNSPGGSCILMHKAGTDRDVFQDYESHNNSCST